MFDCCDVCGHLLSRCACPACWRCGERGKLSCETNHRLSVYLEAVEAVLAAHGGNSQAAADTLGINNTHLYIDRRKLQKKYISPTLKRALYRMGYMRIKRQRFRLAAEWGDEGQRQAFIEQVLDGKSFTEWVTEKSYE